MEELDVEVKMNPADYYKGLDTPVKMLFKKELIRRLEWSHRTFALRMKLKNFRPAEHMMIESIITNKSFLDV